MAISQRSKSRMSMWFAEVHPVNRQVSPVPGAATPTIDGCGQNFSTLAKPLERPGSWQKTLLESLASSLEDCTGSSGKWKPWATKSNVLGSTALMWVPHIAVPASSLWPTPVTSDARRHAPETPETKLRRGSHTGVCLTDAVGGSPHPDFLDWLMGFPIGWTEHPLSVTQLSLNLPK